MNSITSPSHNGLILDTNVLSLFARANRLDLLHQFSTVPLSTIPLYITPTIQRELEIGVQSGVEYLRNVLQLVEAEYLQVISPNEADKQFMGRVPPKLASGEAEAIALCHRLHLVFISHDRKAINFCERMDIDCIRLTTLLKKLQEAGSLTTDEVQRMLS